MITRAVHAAIGDTWAALAVRSESPESGVVTFFSKRQSLALITEMAAPVSTNAMAGVPSTTTSITFCGYERGLEIFAKHAVRASGTAEISFPRQKKQADGA